MKKRILISILFPLFFIIACYPSSLKGESLNKGIENNDIDDPHEYLLLIDEDESLITTKFGEADWEGVLYGGTVYYYEDLHIAFGLNEDKVSSILLYSGKTKENVKIGMSQEEAKKALNTGKIRFYQDEDLPLTISYYSGSYEYYLNFYDGVLEEIVIKLKD